MNLYIKRQNFTNQSSILLKKIDEVGRASALSYKIEYYFGTEINCTIANTYLHYLRGPPNIIMLHNHKIAMQC